MDPGRAVPLFSAQSEPNAAPPLQRDNTVEKGVFHQRLNDRGWDPDTFQLFRTFHYQLKLILIAVVLNADIIFDDPQLFFHGRKVFVVGELDPVLQQIDQRPGNAHHVLVSFLFGKVNDRVERIVNKMRIDLRHQHFILQIVLVLFVLQRSLDVVIQLLHHSVQFIAQNFEFIVGADLYLRAHISRAHTFHCIRQNSHRTRQMQHDWDQKNKNQNAGCQQNRQHTAHTGPGSLHTGRILHSADQCAAQCGLSRETNGKIFPVFSLLCGLPQFIFAHCAACGCEKFGIAAKVTQAIKPGAVFVQDFLHSIHTDVYDQTSDAKIRLLHGVKRDLKADVVHLLHPFLGSERKPVVFADLLAATVLISDRLAELRIPVLTKRTAGIIPKRNRRPHLYLLAPHQRDAVN